MIKSFSRICIFNFGILLLSVLFLNSCSETTQISGNEVKQNGQIENPKRTELGTTDTVFLEQSYITESLDFALYNAWLQLNDALALADPTMKYNSNKTQEAIATAQNLFLQELEREKHLKTYNISNTMYGIKN